MNSRHSRLAMGLFVLSLALPSAAQAVFIAEDKDNLQSIIDAAPDGSTILLRAGNYDQSIVIGKELTLAAYDQEQVTLHQVLVSFLTADESVLLRGLRIIPLGAFGGATRILSCAGVVIIEDSVTAGTFGDTLGTPEGIRVLNSPEVIVRNTLASGGRDVTFGNHGPAILAENSRVFVYGSQLVGVDDCNGLGLMGGSGVVAMDSLVFLQDSHAAGGQGGFAGNPFDCGEAGSGGHGIEAMNSSVVARNSSLAGGPAGIPDCAGGLVGTAGQPFVGDPLQLTQLGASPAGHFANPNPARTGNTVQIDFVGQPGDVAILFFTPEPNVSYVPGLFGAWTLATPSSALGSVLLDGSGLGQLNPTASLPPGMLGNVYHTQTLFIELGSSTLTLGPPQALLILDASL